MRTRWRLRTDEYELAVVTLYGDHDEDFPRLLWLLLNEAIPIAERCHQPLIIEREHLEIPAD